MPSALVKPIAALSPEDVSPSAFIVEPLMSPITSAELNIFAKSLALVIIYPCASAHVLYAATTASVQIALATA